MPNQAQLVFGEAGGSSVAYDVPHAQIIELVCATASFDGGGSAGAWFPAVEVVSDSGHVISRTVTPQSVPAGGSADVTFAPFLGAVGTGGGGGFDPSTALPFNGGELHVHAILDVPGDNWQTEPDAGGYVVVSAPALGDPSPDAWVIPVLRLVGGL